MTAVTALPSSLPIIQVVNEANLSKIENFLNDTAYREAIENSSNYNTRLCRERRLRMPFLDSQTGVAQNHSALFMSSRERLPGLLHGQIYTYPSKRWRKKRRQYLMHYLHPKRTRGDIEDGIEGIEGTITGVNDDSKDSVALKELRDSLLFKTSQDEHSKDGWYFDEQDILEMDAYEEHDPDSDYDYEESYSSKRKRRRPRGGGHHPARSHPPATDSPGPKRAKGGGRGRKKTNYDVSDSDKPFVCDRGTRRGRQSTASSSTSTPSPAPPTTTISSVGASVQPQQQQQQQQQQLPPVQTCAPPASPNVSATKDDQQNPVGSPSAGLSTSPTSIRPDGTPVTSTTAASSSSTVTTTTTLSTTTTTSATSSPTIDKKTGKAAVPSTYCDFCLGDARENKKTGGSEELVSCSDCGRSGKIEEKTKRKYTRRANHN